MKLGLQLKVLGFRMTNTRCLNTPAFPSNNFCPNYRTFLQVRKVEPQPSNPVSFCFPPSSKICLCLATSMLLGAVPRKWCEVRPVRGSAETAPINSLYPNFWPKSRPSAALNHCVGLHSGSHTGLYLEIWCLLFCAIVCKATCCPLAWSENHRAWYACLSSTG